MIRPAWAFVPNARRIVLAALAVVALAGCAGKKYAGPDWALSDEWRELPPGDAASPPPPLDNALPPRRLYGAGLP